MEGTSRRRIVRKDIDPLQVASLRGYVPKPATILCRPLRLFAEVKWTFTKLRQAIARRMTEQDQHPTLLCDSRIQNGRGHGHAQTDQ